MATCLDTPALQRLSRQIADKKALLRAKFTKDEDGRYNMSKDVCDEIQKLEADIAIDDAEHKTQLGYAQREAQLEEDRKALQSHRDRMGDAGGYALDKGHSKSRELTLSDRIQEAPEFKDWTHERLSGNSRAGCTLRFENIRLTTMTTAAGFAPENLRIAKVVPYALQMPFVEDLIPHTATSATLIKFMKETTHTNAMAPTAEGDAKPELALAFTEDEEAVRKIAGYLPVTDEQLDDVPGILGIIEQRLMLMAKKATETQLLTGDGNAPNLTGFLNLAGIQTQAKGADSVADAIFKGIVKVQTVGFADPSNVIMHPNDWQDLRLTQTTEGVYIWGPPSDTAPPRVWGLPVLATTSMTENTTLVGDFPMFSQIFEKEGVVIIIGFINDDLIKNKKTIVVERRLALVVYRDTAFCKVTGI